MFTKKIKKALAVVAVVAIGTIGLVGCNKGTDVEKVGENDDFKITLILDEGGVNDQSFNQSAWEGALSAKEEYGVEVNYIESNQESEYLTNIETAVDSGSDLIVGIGFKLTDAIKESAEAYPDQKFAIIDGVYDEIPTNLKPILFNEEQSGYAVGLIAGNTTKTNKIGFIGGMEIPSVTKFLDGFEKALKEVNPNVNLVSQYANSFTDASKGKAIAQQMINDGVDIVFTAGGGVNSGVYEVAKEKGKYAIGVDMPQNYIAPETILTSALKNVGTGVKSTIKELVDGQFKGGEAQMFDLSNGGVGFEETPLIPEDVLTLVKEQLNMK